MSKKSLEQINVLLMLIAFLGGLLIYNDLALPLAFILFAGAFIGTVIIVRYLNSLPFDNEEQNSWKNTRESGKSQFVLGYMLRFGVFSILGFILFESVKSFLLNKPVFEDFSFTVLIILLIIFFGVPIFAAVEIWRLQEEKYRKSLSQENLQNL